MNEEQVLKLAEEIGDYFSDDYGDRCVQFNNVTILAFANACCEYQREKDAKLIERTDMKNLAEHDVIMAGFTANLLCGLTTAILANKGE